MTDKDKHFIAGIFISAVTLVLFGSLFVAVSSTIIIGLMKEVHDYMVKDNTSEVLDCVATMLGCIPTIVFYLIYLLFT